MNPETRSNKTLLYLYSGIGFLNLSSMAAILGAYIFSQGEEVSGKFIFLLCIPFFLAGLILEAAAFAAWKVAKIKEEKLQRYQTNIFSPLSLNIALPRVIARRDQVQSLFFTQQVMPDLSNISINILCSDLATGSPSAADEIIKEALVRRKAEQVTFIAAPDRFVQRIYESSNKLNLNNKILIRNALREQVSLDEAINTIIIQDKTI